MKHILWVSRHAPTHEQLTLLSKILKDEMIIVTRHEKSVNEHEELVQKYRSEQFDDIVVTLPIDMIGKLCTAKIHPIRAVHKMTGCEPGTNMRTYKFLGFERIHSVSVQKERL